MKKVRIASLIERIGNLLRSGERGLGAESGLQPVHIQILSYLSQCNRYSNTPAGVTEFIGSTKGTTSQSINILEKKGFIIKIPDKEDRRMIHLELTAKAKGIIDNTFPPKEFSKTLDELSAGDSELLFQLLTKLLVRIQYLNDGRVFGVCHTCRHFKKYGLGETHQCGLTQEPLSERESFQICREHQEPAQRAI